MAISTSLQIGCAPNIQRHDWSAYGGPGAAYFQREEYRLPFADDPLEPVNRIAFGLNAAFVVAIADPLATGWRFLVPADVRRSLVNAADNIEYPRRGLNHLLQGHPTEAKTETERFAINSTLGVLGLVDPATERGIDPANTDTGKTLQKWGWTESTYLTLPFGMPGTIRDVIGGVGDALLDPTVYFYPAAPIKGAIVGAERVDDVKRFLWTHQDAYEPARRLYMAQREDVAPHAPTNDADGPALQTLKYVRFAPQDPWFAQQADTHRVQMRETGRSLPYDVWMQESAAPVVFLLPGFGAHRQALPNVALAEVLFNAGYSVATISSAMNFEFMRNATARPFPGDAPSDAADVNRALARIASELENKYGDRISGRAVVGVSMGGYHALFMAGAPRRDAPMRFDAYVAVCPPIRLRHAAEAIDAYYNAPMAFPEVERDARALAALRAGVRLVGGSGQAGEIDEADARFLVGVNYRLALHDMIWVTRERHDAGVLQTEWNGLLRAPASQEILDYSLMEYAYGFLLPHCAGPEATEADADGLFRRADVRSLEGALRSNHRVAVVTNENDFLLADGDVALLAGVLGPNRLTVHSTGGHTGNLAEKAVQTAILNHLAALLGRSEEYAACPGR